MRCWCRCQCSKYFFQTGFLLRGLTSNNLESFSQIGLDLPKLLRIKVNFHVVLMLVPVLVQVPVLKIIFVNCIFLRGLRSIYSESFSPIGLNFPELLRIKVNCQVVLVLVPVLVQVPVLKIIFANWFSSKGSQNNLSWKFQPSET